MITNVYVVDQVCAKRHFSCMFGVMWRRIVSHFSHPYDYLYEIVFILDGGHMKKDRKSVV